MLLALRTCTRFQCKQYLNRQIFSGFSDSSKSIIARTLCDSVNKRALEARSTIKPMKLPFRPKNSQTKPKTPENDFKAGQSKNAEILRARYCQEAPKKPPEHTPPPPPPQDQKSNWPWISALAGIGGVGLFYYFYSVSQSKKDPHESADKHVPTLVKVPATSAEIPKEVPYLLIGGGTASFSAFRAIKSHDPKAKVLVITNEFDKPYMRPPLSKELWYYAEPNVIPKDFKFQQWNGAQRSLYYEPDEFYIDPTKLMENTNGGVAICQGYTVKQIDVCDKKVVLTDGTEIFYGECLIATGCSPKLTDVFNSAPQNVKEKISTFRTTRDYETLKTMIDSKKSVAIVGGGFLGSELACALAKYGVPKNVKIYQVFHETGNMANVLPEYLSKWTTEQIQKQGVCIIPQAQIENVSASNGQVKLMLNNGKSVLTDHVVVCLGCEANTQFADVSGLEVDSNLGGFVVNAELEARRHLFVAGDAACFYDPLLGRRRVEHHDHSVVSGRLAGENMVGLKKPFTHQSMFWSDLGPTIGYEGIGLIDSSLPTVGVFAKLSPSDVQKNNEGEESGEKLENKENVQKPENVENTALSEDNYGKGVIFYMRNDKIVGILLWNLFNRINTARKIINESKKFDDLNEVAKLFEIHS